MVFNQINYLQKSYKTLKFKLNLLQKNSEFDEHLKKNLIETKRCLTQLKVVLNKLKNKKKDMIDKSLLSRNLNIKFFKKKIFMKKPFFLKQNIFKGKFFNFKKRGLRRQVFFYSKKFLRSQLGRGYKKYLKTKRGRKLINYRKHYKKFLEIKKRKRKKIKFKLNYYLKEQSYVGYIKRSKIKKKEKLKKKRN